MERITVGIDAENASQVALDWTIRRARERAVEIRLVTVDDYLMADPTGDEERLAAASHRVQKAVPGTDVRTSVIDGSIVEALVECSRQSDLMVLGYHRTRAIRSMFAGALSARIAARSTCATVIVPDDWKPRKGTVVTGVGEDDTATTALEFAAREAMHPRRELHLVHGWRLPTPTWGAALHALAASADDLRQGHRDLLDSQVEAMRERYPALKVRGDLVEASATAALLSCAERAELLVLGTHRRSPMSGLLLGSTALSLLPESRVPVCIVPLVAPLTPVAGQLDTMRR